MIFVVDQLLQALDHVRGRPDAKALLLGDLARALPAGEAAALDAAIGAGLPRALLGFPLPTIAAMPGDTIGGGFLVQRPDTLRTPVDHWQVKASGRSPWPLAEDMILADTT